MGSRRGKVKSDVSTEVSTAGETWFSKNLGGREASRILKAALGSHAQGRLRERRLLRGLLLGKKQVPQRIKRFSKGGLHGEKGGGKAFIFKRLINVGNFRYTKACGELLDNL